MRLIVLIIVVILSINHVLGHSGGTSDDTSQDSDSGLSLTQIYAITLTTGIVLALILYYFDIIRSRKLLYEMIGLAVILLSIDFYIMSQNL